MKTSDNEKKWFRKFGKLSIIGIALAALGLTGVGLIAASASANGDGDKGESYHAVIDEDVDRSHNGGDSDTNGDDDSGNTNDGHSAGDSDTNGDHNDGNDVG